MKSGTTSITFADENDSKAVALAMLGQSNKSILQRTRGLSDGKITYRLSKHQRVEGGKGGYRVGWRNGKSELVKQIISEMASVIQLDIKRNTPGKIAHQPAKMAK